MSEDRIGDEPAHSSHGPSAAEGWSTCLDYVNANRGLPDVTSEAAAEGTFAHAMSDACFEYGLDASALIGIKGKVAGFEFEWDEDDADMLQPGIDRVRKLMKLPGAQFFGEHRVDLSEFILPGQFGTLDRAVLVKIEGVWWIYIIDLKFGRGVPVNPVRNKQIMLYGLGFYRNIAQAIVGDEPVMFRLDIDQPRHAGGGGQWDVSLEDLLAFGVWIKERARLTLEPNPPRTASAKGCMWCRRKRAPGGCDTYEEFMWSLLEMDFDDLDIAVEFDIPMSLQSIMTPERRAYLLEHQSMITRWMDQHYEQAIGDGMAGDPIGPMKVVGGNKAPDTFPDKKATEAVLVSLLAERAFTKQLIRPAKALKEISPDDHEKLIPFIKKGVKKPILVPEADARPPLTAENEFDDLDD